MVVLGTKWRSVRLIGQLGAGGSVIANRGFIREFGNGDAGGDGSVRELDPTWGKLESLFSSVKSGKWPGLIDQSLRGVLCS